MVQTARLFLAGSFIYPAIELLYRKKTHISMAVTRRPAYVCIHKICNGFFRKKNLAIKCIAGSFIITGVELATGLVVNVMMKKKVWDYSGLPLNIKGQVCLPFTVLWGLITIPALMICKLLKCK